MTPLSLFFTACLLTVASAFALTVEAPLPDAGQERQAKALFREIRCVVCQGESIADSPAPIAADMRRLIRRDIAAGDGDGAIKARLVTQYGNAVLMRPPLNRSTILLWFAPPVLLMAGGWLAWRYTRHL